MGERVVVVVDLPDVDLEAFEELLRTVADAAGITSHPGARVYGAIRATADQVLTLFAGVEPTHLKKE